MICTYKQLPMQDGRSTGISEKKKTKKQKEPKLKKKKAEQMY